MVLLDGRPAISFAHEVRLHGDADGIGLVRLPLEAGYRGGPTDPPTGGPLPAVGFVVWRAGPVQ